MIWYPRIYTIISEAFGVNIGEILMEYYGRAIYVNIRYMDFREPYVTHRRTDKFTDPV